jgi:hypothetical protein
MKSKPPAPHVFVTRKTLSWPYCAKCGLVALKNKATEKAIRKGCGDAT